MSSPSIYGHDIYKIETKNVYLLKIFIFKNKLFIILEIHSRYYEKNLKYRPKKDSILKSMC